MSAPASPAAAAPRGSLHRLAAGLGALSGWRRYLLALILGGLAAAALPPLYLLPLLWPAFTGLLWLLDGAARRREAFFIAWAFGTGHFIAGLYWVGIAFFVDADRFGAFAPAAVLGLSAGLALFPATAVLLLHLSGWRGLPRLFLLAALWLLAEWLRGWLLTGFPWNLIGSVWTFSESAIQLASVTGVWGLSWLTILFASAPALLGEAEDGAGGIATRRVLLVLCLALVGPALLWAGGAMRLAAVPAAGSDRVPGVTLRLVQPSIEQALKWHPELRQKHVADQMAMTVEPGFDKVTHVIWSETAVPFFLANEEALRRAIAPIVPAEGYLITGAPRSEEQGRDRRLWNSLHAMDREGDVVATYDKVNLVPFGEYVPLRSWLGFAKLTTGGTDFTAGPGRVTIDLPGLPPFSPLICYEVIFPGQVTVAGERPQWLLSVTNDAWFGTSSGPYQHFASARLRAVEEGLPMVRVANNGITAVVDSYGRVLSRLGQNHRGVIDTHLPRAIESATIYATTSIYLVIVILFVTVALCFFARRNA